MASHRSRRERRLRVELAFPKLKIAEEDRTGQTEARSSELAAIEGHVFAEACLTEVNAIDIADREVHGLVELGTAEIDAWMHLRPAVGELGRAAKFPVMHIPSAPTPASR